MKRDTPLEELDRLKGRDPELMDAEGEALHEKVVAEFADVRRLPAYPAKDAPQTIAKESIDWLANRRELAVGKPAPMFTGKDLDGNEFSLKDYRGKVVALVFWASWCAPCMQEVPHEKELVKTMEGKPFALLGVNSDDTPEKARQAIAEEKITWPNWYDGDSQKSRPIRNAYRILGLPAIFVLDGKGMIRFKGVRDKKLVEAVESLLKEMETEEARP